MEGFEQNNFPTEKKEQKGFELFLNIVQVAGKILPVFIFWVIIAVIILAFVIGLSILPYSSQLKVIMNQSLEGKQHIEQAQIFVNQQKFLSASNELKLAEDNFSTAEEELAVLAQKPVFKLPGVRKQVVIADEILYVGRSLSSSLGSIADFASEILYFSDDEIINLGEVTDEQKKEILSGLVELGDELDETKYEITQIQIAWDSLRYKKDNFIWRPVIEPLNEVLPSVFKVFDYIIIASDHLPSFLGYPDEKVYLFLMQNNNEIRPAGGFIGTYGVIKMQNASLTEFETDNVYNLDDNIEGKLFIDAPYPITTYMGVEYWYMRDSNWWADFPTSARKVEEFYRLEGGPEKKIDGVIAINQDLVEDLLGLVGPITVEGITFNEDNFTEELQQQVEVGFYQRGLPMSERKNIIGDMAKILEEKIMALPITDWKLLADIIEDNLNRKHVLGYFKDVGFQQWLEEQNWAGRVRTSQQDYIQVVDANLASLKTDSVMSRDISYTLKMQDNNLIGNLEVKYTNEGGFTIFTTRYRSYSRFYLPKGSELISVQIGDNVLNPEDVDVYEEFGHTAYGLYLQVEPQSSTKVILQYKLPAKIKSSMKGGSYELMVQKQPGIREIDLYLDLQFGDEFNVFGNEENQVSYFERINQDQVYTILFEQ